MGPGLVVVVVMVRPVWARGRCRRRWSRWIVADDGDDAEEAEVEVAFGRCGVYAD